MLFSGPENTGISVIAISILQWAKYMYAIGALLRGVGTEHEYSSPSGRIRNSHGFAS